MTTPDHTRWLKLDDQRRPLQVCLSNGTTVDFQAATGIEVRLLALLISRWLKGGPDCTYTEVDREFGWTGNHRSERSHPRYTACSRLRRQLGYECVRSVSRSALRFVPPPDDVPVPRAAPWRRSTNLPPRPEHFIGRELELREIGHRLRPPRVEGALRRPVGLVGLAGIGKSALACEYAHRHLKSYRHICWLNAGGRDVSFAFAALAEDPLDLRLPDNTGLADRVRAVKAHLERSGPHLLIFDNVEHADSWQGCVPVSADTVVLVTTRLECLDHTHLIHVDRMSEDRALMLLLSADDTEPGAVEDGLILCRVLDRHTLSLTIAGRILARGVRTPAELTEAIRERGMLAVLDPTDAAETGPGGHGLSHVFDTSISLLLEAGETGTLARSMLLVAAWFGAGAIPRELLQDALGKLTGLPVGRLAADLALEELVALGLVQLVSTREPLLHRLVQACARQQGGPAPSLAVLEALGGDAEKISVDHTSHGRLVARHAHWMDAAARVQGSSPAAHLWIALRLVQLSYRFGAYDTVIELCSRLAPEIAEGAWTAYFQHEWGAALVNLDLSAVGIAHLEEALTMKQRYLGNDHMQTGITLQMLGRAYTRCGQYQRAIDVCERALAIEVDAGAGGELEASITLHTIGQCLSLLHIYDKAVACFVRAVEIKERVVGKDSVSLSHTLTALAESLIEYGRPDEALKLTERAFKIQERELGPAHAVPAITLRTQGNAYAKLGEWGHAISNLRKSLTLLEHALGAEHSSTARTSFALGRALVASGDATGCGLMASAADRLRNRLGREHPEVVAVMEQLCPLCENSEARSM